jgi:hypothetical protein
MNLSPYSATHIPGLLEGQKLLLLHLRKSGWYVMAPEVGSVFNPGDSIA